jgi:hypothetical protein
VHGLERDDVPGGIVEHAVDTHGFLGAVDEQMGAVADVPVSERAGPLAFQPPRQSQVVVDARPWTRP